MTLSSAEDNNLVPNVPPVGMQNSALVLHDGDENSAVTELEELSSGSEQNISPCAINIENSKDVIIGPVTQFNGPVTIYQNVNGPPKIENTTENKTSYNTNDFQNGKLVKSESTSSDTPHAAEKTNKNSLLFSKHLKYIGIPVILLIIIVVITCAVILSIKTKKGETSTSDFTKEDFSEEDEPLKPVGSGSMIDKASWHGMLPNYTQPLEHPTPLIIISHTATPTCATFPECSRRVQSIQSYHMNDLGLPDIGHNFLIGSDANVYVGRGWDVKNFHAPGSIAIGFIGNYIKDHLTEAMITTARALIDEGAKSGKLSEDYKIVCHNQTYPTASPGYFVYQVVKTWPHFDPTSYIRKKN